MSKSASILVAVMLLILTGVCLAGSGDSLQQENALLRHRIERLENALEELKKAPPQSTPTTGTKTEQTAGKAVQTPNTDIANLQKENDQLKQRIAKLEGAIGELKSTQTKQAQTPAPAAPAAPPVAPVAAPKEPAPAPAAGADQKKTVWSSLDIQLYGYVKADASYDTSRTTPGNYVLYVDSEATNENDDEFNMTANQTRLGLNITGPTTDTMKSSGCIEFDFFGNYASENKAKIQMRHAYMTLDWPESRFSIIAGQTWDIMSPLNPNTLNYSVLWDAGNIAYRRPQFRLTKGFALNEQVILKLEGGVARTIGRTDMTGSESGEDAGYPTAEGRVSMTFPFFGPKPTTIGVSGHNGTEEYDLDSTGTRENFHSWSANLDVTQPVITGVTILGELFIGENLDNYFGGIGQGVNTTTRQEIASKGGWISASLGPWEQFSFNVGGGVDDVDDDDVNAGNRTYNSSVFGNVLYAVNKNVQVGLEISQWDTHYKGQERADDTRAQAAFTYKF
jgi:cell division septum initiation protein DivIVA